MAYQFKIGDKVKFIENNQNIPKYYTNNDGIPCEKLTHGITYLGDEYYKNFAKIVDIYNEYYLVEWISKNNKIMRLGFKAETLELLESIAPNKIIMSTIKEFVKNSFLSKEEKLLRKQGLKNECGDYTQDAKDLVIEKLTRENEEFLLEVATKKDEEEKEEK